MIILLFILCSLVVYAAAVFTLPVYITPEFFFYPWLVVKGLVQYKDFFDHHGFLTNILLSSLASPSSIQNISFVFIAMQLIQCTLIVKMLIKKVKHPLYTILILVLYLAFQFAIVAQQLWFDTWMAFFIVIAWYLFEEKRQVLGWIFVAAATMVKPTAALFLLPFFLRSTRKLSTITFFIAWLVFLIYFLIQGAGSEFWKQLILFNTIYIQSTYKTFFIGMPIKLLFLICGGFGLLLLVAIKRKSKNIPLLLATLISFSFFFQGLSRVNFSLFVPFCVLLISEVLHNKKMSKIGIFTLVLFICIALRDCLKTYKDVQKRQLYISNTVLAEARQINLFLDKKSKKNVLVVGNRVELYFLLNMLPPEFTPLHFPWVEKVYGNTLDMKEIGYIIIPKKLNEYETISPSIKKSLKNFHNVGQTASYTIWRYNRI